MLSVPKTIIEERIIERDGEEITIVTKRMETKEELLERLNTFFQKRKSELLYDFAFESATQELDNAGIYFNPEDGDWNYDRQKNAFWTYKDDGETKDYYPKKTHPFRKIFTNGNIADLKLMIIEEIEDVKNNYIADKPEIYEYDLSDDSDQLMMDFDHPTEFLSEIECAIDQVRDKYGIEFDKYRFLFEYDPNTLTYYKAQSLADYKAEQEYWDNKNTNNEDELK